MYFALKHSRSHINYENQKITDKSFHLQVCVSVGRWNLELIKFIDLNTKGTIEYKEVGWFQESSEGLKKRSLAFQSLLDHRLAMGSYPSHLLTLLKRINTHVTHVFLGALFHYMSINNNNNKNPSYLFDKVTKKIKQTHKYERVLRKIKGLHNVIIHYYKINHCGQMLNPIGFGGWNLAGIQ